MYKPLAQRHNKIYKKLVKEKDTLKEDEDIKKAKKLIRHHTVYSQEFQVSFILMDQLVIEHGFLSWQEKNGDIIS